MRTRVDITTETQNQLPLEKLTRGQSGGPPPHPEALAGTLIPVVLWAVRRTTKRIHDKRHANH